MATELGILYNRYMWSFINETECHHKMQYGVDNEQNSYYECIKCDLLTNVNEYKDLFEKINNE